MWGLVWQLTGGEREERSADSPEPPTPIMWRLEHQAMRKRAEKQRKGVGYERQDAHPLRAVIRRRCPPPLVKKLQICQQLICLLLFTINPMKTSVYGDSQRASFGVATLNAGNRKNGCSLRT